MRRVGETGPVNPAGPLSLDTEEGDTEPPAEEASTWPVLYSLQQALQDLVAVFLSSTVVYAGLHVFGWLGPMLAWIEGVRAVELTGLHVFAVLVTVGFGLIGFRRWIQLTETTLGVQATREELDRRTTRLERRTEELEGFAYAAAHDLREPLRMVDNYLQLVDRNVEEGVLDPESEEFLSEARRAARRMDDMVRGLVNYATLEPQGEDNEPTDPDVALDAALDAALRDSTGALGPDVHVEREPLPPVQASMPDLVAIFEQLLQNAATHGGPDLSTVRVTGGREGDEAWIRVVDDGQGIDPSREDRVFELFRHPYGSSNGAGAGLGLALCRRLAERHDGSIALEPDAEESGACFRITMPAADAPKVEA